MLANLMSQYLHTTGVSRFVGRFTLGGVLVVLLLLLPVSVMLTDELKFKIDSGLVLSLFFISLSDTYFEFNISELFPVRIIDNAGFSWIVEFFTLNEQPDGICSMLHSRFAIWAIGHDGLNPIFSVAFGSFGRF